MADPADGVSGGGGFLDNFVGMSDSLGAWLSHGLNVGDFVTASDYAAATAVHTPQAPGELADAGGEAIGAVGGAIADATSKAVTGTLTPLVPYLLAAGLVWVAVETRRAR